MKSLKRFLNITLILCIRAARTDKTHVKVTGNVVAWPSEWAIPKLQDLR